ncbi:trihelix transcription factor ASR3-like [Lolium rigidum]|uniref:trihelix transcription factor ASR3-like n=1 Tax=Lolium rigidum TaxID=89674 RepID=UPI001F5D594E|nr:trihelix transcription factor ASR3-like [Lolium rigidum]
MSNAGDPAGAAAAAATPSGRAPRLPRWTRQEILVLIEGKRVVEVRGGGRGGRGRIAAAGEATALEPKWAAVAEYCRRHGVERGAVQCRKRWSNLAGDYKKIKEWERAAAASASREPSFWAMRNDARRERRLPGFFDREVYDILEGRGRGIVAGSSSGGNAAEEEEVVREQEDGEEEERGEEKEVAVEETVFDSGRPAGEEALFSEDEEGEDDETPKTTQAPPPAVIALPISEKSEASRQQSTEQGTSKEKQHGQQGSPTQQQQQQSRQKRQRTDSNDGEPREEGMADLQGNKLLEILDRNSRMVEAQLEAQNVNSERDREQRREQANSLAVVLGRLADALGRIADKL